MDNNNNNKKPPVFTDDEGEGGHFKNFNDILLTVFATFITVIVWSSLLYFGACFISWETNPGLWEKEIRGLLAFLWFTGTGLIITYVLYNWKRVWQ